MFSRKNSIKGGKPEDEIQRCPAISGLCEPADQRQADFEKIRCFWRCTG
jgi:hypothetical protein